jgi:hypothetical protein
LPYRFVRFELAGANWFLNVAFVGFRPALVAVFWPALPLAVGDDDAVTDVFAWAVALPEAWLPVPPLVVAEPEPVVFAGAGAPPWSLFTCPGAFAEFPFPLPLAYAEAVKALNEIVSTMVPTAAACLNM